MLLCPGHHKQLDDLEPDHFSVETLVEMKEKHLQGCKGTTWKPGDDELTRFARLAIQEWYVLQLRIPAEPQTIVMAEPAQGTANVGLGGVITVGEGRVGDEDE